MNAKVSNKILTLPNLITFIRLLLVPLFALLLLSYQNNVAAFFCFVIAATTDFLDGTVARATGTVSRLGQKLDPLVDRVLILTAVTLVFIIGRVPLWILLLLVARDLSMLVLLSQLRATGQAPFRVAFVGKVATALNMTGFSLLILYWPEIGGLGLIETKALPGWGTSPAPLGIWFIYAGVACAWAAGFYYMLRAFFESERPRKGEQSHPKGQVDGFGNIQKKQSKNTDLRSGQQAHMMHPMRSNKRDLYNKDLEVTRKQSFFAHANTNRHTTKRGRVNTKAKSPTLLSRLLNSPKRLLLVLVALACVLLVLGFYSYDAASNFGVIHARVKVGTVDVGHRERASAAELLETELSAVALSAPITFYANEEERAQGVNETTQQLGNGVNIYNQTNIDPDATSWSATLGSFDAEVNGMRLAEEAYGVGRGDDFIFGRLGASFFGVTVTPTLDFSKERLRNLETLLTESIGTPMVNAGIEFDGTTFSAYDGRDGIVVDEDQFISRLHAAFLTEDRAFVVPMVEQKMHINLEDAEQVAKSTQEAIEEAVTVTYGEDAWELAPEFLGQVLASSVKDDGSGKEQLVVYVDAGLLQARLPEIIGAIDEQVEPLNAGFVEIEGELQLVPSQNGIGVDYPRLAKDLSTMLFGSASAAEGTEPSEDVRETEEANSEEEGIASSARRVPMYIGVIQADFQTSDAESYNFSTKISEYTIEYWWVSQGTITNIHVASDLLNSSIIDPHSTWSFNERAGECTADKGFVEAQIILGDEYVDEIGGGVCSVATTVYNAVYEAGYPIIERSNHSLRLTRYPPGRDAAIAYPYADLKFENDTESHLLLTMSYTDHSVTCTLWGISPGYTVESSSGELIETADFESKETINEELAPGQRYVEQEGKKGSKIAVTRTVYDSFGNLKEQRTFYSSYDPTPELVQLGPEA